jgi:hypothetical protein
MKFYYRPHHPLADQHGFVNELELGDYQEPKGEMAIHANIMVDRFYEGIRLTDGTDVGSRRKHRAYLKEHGYTTADDYTETWKKAAEERKKIESGEIDQKERREIIGKALYEAGKGRK